MSNQTISGIATAVFVTLVVGILLAFGYNPPDPPIPEEGVEVNLGDSDYGLGAAMHPASTPNNAPPAAQEQVATQQTDHSIAMPSTQQQGGVVNPEAQPQTQPEEKQPEINDKAIFPGMRNRDNNSSTGSQGISQGQGDQGKSNGNPNSNNYVGQGKGDGYNWNLTGRSAVNIAKPDYKSNEQGTVVVRVWVNRQGKVVRAEYEPKGSTIPGSSLRDKAVEAARQARFNADPKATEEQTGTITYIFKI
ncbi:MAG: TonB family protein [Bacteroidales bacterium]|nr:TonB family protein [Bacteroidales bacterium]